MPARHVSPRELTTFFKALADETRRRVLLALASGGEMCVSDVIHRVGAAQYSVSRHLAILKAAGLVQYRREGRRKLYRCHYEGLHRCCHDFFGCLGMLSPPSPGNSRNAAQDS